MLNLGGYWHQFDLAQVVKRLVKRDAHGFNALIDFASACPSSQMALCCLNHIPSQIAHNIADLWHCVNSHVQLLQTSRRAYFYVIVSIILRDHSGLAVKVLL